MSDAEKSLTPVQRWLILSALTAVVAGLGYWWYTTLEWEEKEIDLGYSKEARQNDFLAAEIFLRKQGIQATTVKNLSLLDKHSWRNLNLGAQDTIVIINGYKTLTQERYDSLYEWVENGGTLITSTQNPFIGTHTSEEDVLLNDFNIELEPEKVDQDTRDFLEKLADGFDEEDESDSESDDEKSDAEKSDEDESDDEKDTSADKTSTDKATEEKAVAEKSGEKTDADSNNNESSNKKDKRDGKEKSKKEEKPENYYRCALDETPTPITFASEEKPLNFDFSRRSQFIYYDYVAHDEDTDEDTDQSETPTDEDIDTSVDAEETESVTTEKETDEEDYHYDEKREHLLYFDIGAGSVTITSDNTIWANQRIDCHDHAYGLWQLVNPDGRVWFLINQDAPSLATILWRNASYGVIAGIIALVLWLWALSVRFGPVLVVEQTGRRSLAEHIYASAMLLWRKQQHPQLLNLLRKEILERLDEQHPNLNQASGDERLEFLHQLTGIAQADIKQALFADGLHHPQEFAAAIAHLQTILKQLSGNSF